MTARGVVKIRWSSIMADFEIQNLSKKCNEILILAKLAGFSSTTAKAILLLKAADRGMSAQDLDQALTSYGRLHAETARRVLGFHRTRVRGPAAAPLLTTSG